MPEHVDICWVWDGAKWATDTTHRSNPIDLLHISDLHLGQPGRDHESALKSLCEEVADLAPEVLIVSGDVAHVPEDEEAFSAAYTALEALGIPYHVVPGNHDVAAPYPAESRFDDYFGMTPRVEEYDTFQLVLLDSFRFLSGEERTAEDRARGRRGHFAHGAVSDEQLSRVEQRICPRGNRHRVVVVHHHLHEHRPEIGRESPTDADREQMRPLYDVDRFLEWCHNSNVDLVLTGHQHAWTPPEQFRGIPNVRGTKTLASHGVARMMTFLRNGDIRVADHRIQHGNPQ